MRVYSPFAFVVVASLVLVSSASAGFVTYDDFSGVAVDTTKWTERGSSAGSYVESGVLTVDNTGGAVSDLMSTTAFVAPTGNSQYDLRISLGATAPTGGFIFGVCDSTQQSYRLEQRTV